MALGGLRAARSETGLRPCRRHRPRGRTTAAFGVPGKKRVPREALQPIGYGGPDAESETSFERPAFPAAKRAQFPGGRLTGHIPTARLTGYFGQYAADLPSLLVTNRHVIHGSKHRSEYAWQNAREFPSDESFGVEGERPVTDIRPA